MLIHTVHPLIHDYEHTGEVQVFLVAVEHKLKHFVVKVVADQQDRSITYTTPKGLSHEDDDILHFSLEHLLIAR